MMLYAFSAAAFMPFSKPAEVQISQWIQPACIEAL